MAQVLNLFAWPPWWLGAWGGLGSELFEVQIATVQFQIESLSHVAMGYVWIPDAPFPSRLPCGGMAQRTFRKPRQRPYVCCDNPLGPEYRGKAWVYTDYANSPDKCRYCDATFPCTPFSERRARRTRERSTGSDSAASAKQQQQLSQLLRAAAGSFEGEHAEAAEKLAASLESKKPAAPKANAVLAPLQQSVQKAQKRLDTAKAKMRNLQEAVEYHMGIVDRKIQELRQCESEATEAEANE